MVHMLWCSELQHSNQAFIRVRVGCVQLFSVKIIAGVEQRREIHICSSVLVWMTLLATISRHSQKTEKKPPKKVCERLCRIVYTEKWYYVCEKGCFLQLLYFIFTCIK